MFHIIGVIIEFSMAEVPRGLSCSVCYNNFKSDEIQYVPRNLICGHTYCTGCLNKLAFQARNPGVICCPTCKIDTTLFPKTFESVRNLPKNFGVLEILEGKEEVQTDGIHKEKEKNKYLCPEHDEALKVYCYTDNCLICIYCQVYGKHVGHKCELAINIATSTREELRSLSKKLGDHYDTIKKARKKVIDTRESILNTQQYVRNRIMKHMGVLKACISRRETMLKCDVDERTTRKTKPLDEQESLMSEIINKCDLAYSMIQKYQDNDSALIDEKQNIYKLVDEVSALVEKCELEPQEVDNLTYYFEYDIACTLETQIGEVRYLKPGEKENPFAGLNKHELSKKKICHDAWSQTDEVRSDRDHPLFASLLQGLEEIVHTGLTAQSWDNRPALELHVHEADSSDHSSSESALEEIDGPSAHSEDEENDDANDNDDNDDESEVELEGAVGGETLASLKTEPGTTEERRTSLLDELQQEIDRLRLLSPTGDAISLTDGATEAAANHTNSEDAGDDSTRQPNTNDDWSLTVSSPQESLSLDSRTLPVHEQAFVSTDGLSLDSQQWTPKDRSRCSNPNCQTPGAYASRKCQYCRRVFCLACTSVSRSCRKNPDGHHFVSNLRIRGPQPKIRTRVETRKPKKEEGPPWECRQCTMINGPQVLVCLGCDTLREVEAREGRNVCPMCTLVNEPGKTKCELCDTELVSGQEASAAGESSD